MFDPVIRARAVEKLVLVNGKRKYYRFRFARYYGGIVTADAVGCCFFVRLLLELLEEPKAG